MRLSLKKHSFDKTTADTHNQGNLKPVYKPIRGAIPTVTRAELRKGIGFLSKHRK